MVRLSAVALSSLFLSTTLLPQDSSQVPERPGGTAPRASAAKYAAHAEQNGLGIGAERLTKKQMVATFAADVTHCCIVVHVAIYPNKDEPVDLVLVDFALAQVGTDIPIRPESATAIAATLEKDKNPGKQSISTYGSVGYESGTYTDPLTGQPTHVHGVSTTVGVGTGPDNTAPPVVVDRDREVMEHELYEKGLPEAKISSPVAGYLYFRLRAKKDAKYELSYSGSAQPITLSLP